MRIVKEIIKSALLLFLWVVGVAAIMTSGTKRIIKRYE